MSINESMLLLDEALIYAESGVEREVQSREEKRLRHGA